MITEEELEQFSDKQGNVDIVKLLSHKMSKAKSDVSDKYFREGRFDLVEWL